MSWTPNYEPIPYGTSGYPWDWPSTYQCTWYAYFRVQQGSGLSEPPCWYDGSGSSGTGYYTDAKYWLVHYRTPWEIKSLNDTLSVGDIVVFTGTAGHVVVVERVNDDGTYVVSDYNLMGGALQFGIKYDYVYGDIIRGYMTTGACIGALHNPNITPTPPTPTPLIYRLMPLFVKIKNRKRRFINHVKY